MSITTNVDYVEIARMGEQLSTEANEMFNIFRQAQQDMKNTVQGFNSPEGRQARDQFESLGTKFSRFKEDIDAFGIFAKDYSKKMGELKESVHNVAAKLPSSSFD